ncbi:hypothetical protein BN906_02045 [Clostridium tetani 12124569]|nr:hypothetical protein BN906_02045 [Clostridium tetani 12124569]
MGLYFVHIVAFIVLGSLGESHVGKWLDYLNFGIQSTLAIVCLILNALLFLKTDSNLNIKIILFTVNIIQVMATICIFLLPMWAEPPIINLF